ncbi:MAG: alpha-L-fucosidase [Bacteroides sp.]|uniref:alpha-L-fucosidase n=1 Tax=Bacteroides sp. TaxID=29523 RepID=UPI002FCC9F04
MKLKKSFNLIIVASIFAMCVTNVYAQENKEDLSHWVHDHSTAKETKDEYEQRMKWFKDAKFGLFIHWGAYSTLGGEWDGKVSTNGEWIQEMLNIPSSKYQEYVKSFNPVKYNPDEWAHIFKEAGLKYICITTKHHDGFCLWDSKVNNDWDIAVSKSEKDLLTPLAAACRDVGIKYCIYHSVLDWHHPDWPGRPAYNDLASGAPNKERYVKEYLYPQLKELFTDQEIGMIWFDGTWDEKNWSSEDGRQLEEYTRSLQPDVIINNRSGYLPSQPKFDFLSDIKHPYGFIIRGDYITPERDVPPAQMPGLVWETCQTMWNQNSWGYHRLAPFRSTKELIHLLVQVAAKGGNLLLNVGPTSEGEIPIQAKELLLNIGKWLKVNGEAIYGTSASPFQELPFEGYCTRKADKLYFHLTGQPVREINIPLKNKIKRAYFLSTPDQKLVTKSSSGLVSVILPKQEPDPYATVLVLEIAGEPDISPADEFVNGIITLNASEALLQSSSSRLKCEEFVGIKNIGQWTDGSDWIEWGLNVHKEGLFDAYLVMACPETSEGSKISLTIGKQKIDYVVPATSDGWTNYQVRRMGEVKLPSGKIQAVLRAVQLKGEVAKIRKLILIPHND